MSSGVKTYFILDDWNRAVKIGKSKNPEKRLKQLQTGHAHRLQLVGTLEGDHERKLHKLWESRRLNGEWFKADKDLLLYVYQITRNLEVTEQPKKFQGYIAHERHAAVMVRVYAKYKARAISEGVKPEMLVAFVEPLPQSSVVSVDNHQEHLNRARKAYNDHVVGILPTTITHDTSERTEKASQTRLVRKPTSGESEPHTRVH